MKKYTPCPHGPVDTDDLILELEPKETAIVGKFTYNREDIYDVIYQVNQIAAGDEKVIAEWLTSDIKEKRDFARKHVKKGD